MNTPEFYDSYWNSNLHIAAEWDEKRIRKVLGSLLGRERILDYGCGLGHAYKRQLAQAVKSYTGADVSEKALADARQKGFAAVKINSDNSKLDLPDNAFDGAVCVEVFEHLFDPLAATKEIFRVLKPGGVLVATVPNFGYHAW